MNKDQIRAVLAPLSKGQSTTFKTPELIIEVKFDASFAIAVTTRMGSSASVQATPSLKEAVQISYGYLIPKRGQVYQHINSNIYTVVAIANEHSLRPDYPPSVVYQGENGLVWVKPLTNFLAKMTRIK